MEALPAGSEIIVVDNASVDGTAEMVEREYPGVILIRNEVNLRFAGANNQALRRVRNEYVLLLNNDTEVMPGAVERLINALEENPDAAMVGPQLLNPDGSIQPSCHKFPTLWTHMCDMLALDRVFPGVSMCSSTTMLYFDHQSVREVDHLTAAAVLVRMEALRQIGFFDEKLTIYYNDLDLSLRLKREDWKSIFIPEAQILHHGGQTAIQLRTSWDYFVEQQDNIYYYYLKNHGRIVLFLYKVILLIGMLPRLWFWTFSSIMTKDSRATVQKHFTLWTLRHLLGHGKD
ncbi:MAG: glycosyl transferase [Bacteroidia bacterium]|nr:MAG: glycosyl transferase [Bacteroidia bacterium]